MLVSTKTIFSFVFVDNEFMIMCITSLVLAPNMINKPNNKYIGILFYLNYITAGGGRFFVAGCDVH